jgi:hypothetical protein
MRTLPLALRQIDCAKQLLVELLQYLVTAINMILNNAFACRLLKPSEGSSVLFALGRKF